MGRSGLISDCMKRSLEAVERMLSDHAKREQTLQHKLLNELKARAYALIALRGIVSICQSCKKPAKAFEEILVIQKFATAAIEDIEAIGKEKEDG